MHTIAAAAHSSAPSTTAEVFAGIIIVLAVLVFLRFVLGWGPTKRTTKPISQAAAATAVRKTGRAARGAAARTQGSKAQPEDAA